MEGKLRRRAAENKEIGVQGRKTQHLGTNKRVSVAQQGPLHTVLRPVSWGQSRGGELLEERGNGEDRDINSIYFRCAGVPSH